MSTNLKITGATNGTTRIQLSELSTIKQELTNLVTTTNAQFAEKQIHMMWTNTGLLLFVPEANDRSYIHRNDVIKTISSISNNRHIQRVNNAERQEFGLFKLSILLEWKKGAKAYLDRLYYAMSQALIEMVFFFKDGTTRREAESKLGSLDPNLMHLTREFRFIMVGKILAKEDIPDMYFKYMFMRVQLESLRYPCELCEPLRVYYANYQNKDICVFKRLSDYSILDYINGFNNERIINYLGGSILLTFGDVISGARIYTPFINVFSNIATVKPQIKEVKLSEQFITKEPLQNQNTASEENEDDDVLSQASITSISKLINVRPTFL